MPVSIKNRIRSGTLFLFSLLIVMGGMSIYFLVNLKNDSRNIIRDNYESLDYSHGMQKQLDQFSLKESSLKIFDSLLKNQEQNLTEQGEKETTEKLRKNFDGLRAGDSSQSMLLKMKGNLQSIIRLNMGAIHRKNAQAQETSEKATNTIFALASLIFLIGLVFSYNFPSVVVTPIKKLTEGIKEISARNYGYRIRMDKKDEFSQLADAFNNMSEKLEDFESSNLNKLIFEKARAEAVINSLRDASIGIDKANKILFANKQALELLGLSSDDLVGRSVEEVSSRNDLFKFLLMNEGSAPFKIVIDNKENYYVKETISISQGSTENRVIVLKNITSFKELDTAKTNFIATVSHELKTPLASSDLSLKLLEDIRVSALSPGQAELVQQLKNDNRRMLKILSELLNLSQVEAGKIQLFIAAIDMSGIIRASSEAVTASAKEKKIKIIVDVHQLPEMKGDADKISWVINNFLTNAIKFSPVESQITVSSYRTENVVKVEVKDEGPGIDSAFYDKIFERYFQIPGRSDIKGSGIGLAICRELILAMGGEIWVKSEPGDGSIFGFSLPAE